MKLLLSLLLLTCCLQAAEKNIIFIITDDQSQTLGCYGDKAAKTPAVDSLAADGTVFLNAYATTASCAASRSVVMSGVHNHKNGMYGHTHHFHKFSSFHDVVSLSLPRVLANEGYRTGQIGKYHVAPEEVYHFETYLKGNPRNALQMANKCEDFIKIKSDKPFFLYFATSDPHRGGGTNESFNGKFKPDLFGNKPNQGSHDGIKETFYKPEEVVVPEFLPDTKESRAELAEYYQSQARIDLGVARLIEILKEAELYDKTMIVFTADHGMAFPGGKTTVFEGGLKVPFVVRNPYEQDRGIVSKALISHIDITPTLLDFAGGLDQKTNGPKKWVDPKKYWKGKNYAAKENRNGGKQFSTYHGKSWLSILGKQQGEHHTAVHGSHTFHEIQMYYPMRSLRDKEYKIIWNIAHQLPYPFASDLWRSATWQAQLAKGKDAPYGGKTVDSYVNRPAFELYDMINDPNESSNLANNPEYSEILKKYKDKLKDFQQKMEDPWIMKWSYE